MNCIHKTEDEMEKRLKRVDGLVSRFGSEKNKRRARVREREKRVPSKFV